MWWAIVILAVVWLIGLLTSYTLGGWIHILLAAAIILLIVKLMQGKKAM